MFLVFTDYDVYVVAVNDPKLFNAKVYAGGFTFDALSTITMPFLRLHEVRNNIRRMWITLVEMQRVFAYLYTPELTLTLTIKKCCFSNLQIRRQEAKSTYAVLRFTRMVRQILN